MGGGRRELSCIRRVVRPTLTTYLYLYAKIHRIAFPLSKFSLQPVSELLVTHFNEFFCNSNIAVPICDVTNCNHSPNVAEMHLHLIKVNKAGNGKINMTRSKVCMSTSCMMLKFLKFIMQTSS